MFRFGKHRKDGITPVGDSMIADETIITHKHSNKENKSMTISLPLTNGSAPMISRKPPNYQPPPPVGIGIPVASNGGIHHNDVFNHRYSHYANHEELKQQIRYDEWNFSPQCLKLNLPEKGELYKLRQQQYNSHRLQKNAFGILKKHQSNSYVVNLVDVTLTKLNKFDFRPIPIKFKYTYAHFI